MLSPSSAYRVADNKTGPTSRGSMSNLLQRIAKDRSDEAFREVFDEYAPRIKSYMMREGSDAGTAEELAQETLMAVWNKAGLYAAEKGSVAGWIFTIARNLRIDRLRRQTVWHELTETHAAEIAAEDDPADDVVSARQRQARVRAVMGTLPPDQLEVVTLAFIDGLSHSEIADKLDLPLGTVKSRIRLAYQKVRSALEDLR